MGSRVRLLSFQAQDCSKRVLTFAVLPAIPQYPNQRIQSMQRILFHPQAAATAADLSFDHLPTGHLLYRLAHRSYTSIASDVGTQVQAAHRRLLAVLMANRFGCSQTAEMPRQPLRLRLFLLRVQILLVLV